MSDQVSLDMCAMVKSHGIFWLWSTSVGVITIPQDGYMARINIGMLDYMLEYKSGYPLVICHIAIENGYL